jgi:predicted DNA-binding transcriptional regulator YafY
LDKFYEINEVFAGKKAIRDDLKELEKSLLFDVTVNQVSEGVEKYYSHQARLFEIHELRLLIDAVSAARFISSVETERLINKIKKLASDHQAEQLKNRILLPDNVKNEDQRIKNTMHEIHTAISMNHLILFRYGKYNLEKRFDYNRNGQIYEVKPYALVWQNEFYYLIAEYVPKKEIRHYRVDRMRDVSVNNETFLPDPDFDPANYTGMLFFMYSGEEAMVEIEFANHLINVVIDRFGRGVNIRKVNDHFFRVSTQAMISDGLVRWLLTWGSDAKVLTPISLVERMTKEAEKLYRTYQ